jgi:hypothetical protein
MAATGRFFGRRSLLSPDCVTVSLVSAWRFEPREGDW